MRQTVDTFYDVVNQQTITGDVKKKPKKIPI